MRHRRRPLVARSLAADNGKYSTIKANNKTHKKTITNGCTYLQPTCATCVVFFCPFEWKISAHVPE